MKTEAIFFTWERIAGATGGVWLRKPSGIGAMAIYDDSRNVTPGSLFVAIPGELADGHDYVLQASERGARAVCVQRPLSSSVLSTLSGRGCGVLMVDGGLAAFHALACLNRCRFPELRLLSVTGSCGKTSTKEMCASIFETRWLGHVLKTIGNTNNHFGVPRNLLRLRPDTEAAVIEAGSNHPGEIAALGALIRPQSALITCIGAAHLEYFHDLEGVAEEKGDLLAAAAPDGFCIIPADCAGREILLRHAAPRRVITFGTGPESDVRAEYGGPVAGGYAISLTRRDTGERVDFTWGIGGAFQACNAAAAAAAGLAYGLSLSEAAAGLQCCVLPGARMAESDIGGVHWVNDAYNANPDSMRAGLAWFAEASRKASTRWLLLGEMRELGEASPTAHRKVLEEALSLFPHDTVVVTVGPAFAPFAAEHGLRHFEDAAAASVLKFPAGSWVYLKASLAMGLYKLVPKA